MASGDDTGSWGEYEKLVLDQLERNEQGVNRLSEEVREMREEQAILSQNTQAITNLQDRLSTMEKKQIRLQMQAAVIGSVGTLIGSSIVGVVVKILLT